MTELHIAYMYEKYLENLASDVTSLSIPDQYGITAVHYATYQPENLCILVSIVEQRDMLSLLVRQDRKGASCGQTRSAKIIVAYYTSVNMQNSDGDIPLHLCIKGRYITAKMTLLL